MPAILFDTKEAIPSELAAHATEVTDGDNKGKFSVNVVPRKALDEFRDNNVAKSKALEDAEALISKVFGTVGIQRDAFDPEKFAEMWKELQETHRKVGDGKLKASDDIDKVVEARTEAMRNKFDQMLQDSAKKLAEAIGDRDKAIADYRRTFIDRAVASVVTKEDLGVEPSALGDIVNKAYSVFVVEADGTLVPKKNGQTVWGVDGSTPMSVEEWVATDLRKQAPHYFKKSTGGGATGGSESSFGGLSKEAFERLPPAQRLALINEGKVK